MTRRASSHRTTDVAPTVGRRREALPEDGTLLTARGVRTRDALLEAARSLFRGRGYANTKIADITREAGRALGSFYTYFANKEDVLEQFGRDFKLEIDERLSGLDIAGGDPYDGIRELCSVYWTSCKSHSPELAAIFQASMMSPRFADRWREIRADPRARITAGIRALDAAGVASNPEPEATASALGSMMDYFCYVWLIEGGEVDRTTLPDEVAIDTMARVFYRTVFAAPEPRAAVASGDGSHP